jgi:hypothetical protein
LIFASGYPIAVSPRGDFFYPAPNKEDRVQIWRCQHGVDARENLGGIRSRLSGLQVDQRLDTFEVSGRLSGPATA